MNELFRKFAHTTAGAVGSPAAFLIAAAVVVGAGCSSEDEPFGFVEGATNARGTVTTLAGSGLSDVEITFVSETRNVVVGTSRSDGRYFIRLGAHPAPTGTVEFRKAGHMTRRTAFPEGFVDRRDGWYESDVLMTTVPAGAQ